MASPVTRFRREKTAVKIAKDIVRLIRRDKYPIGTRLPPEKDMLNTYQVGRGTLREALRYLELQGVLEIKPGPGGGPIVCSPSSGNLANNLALLLEFSGATFRSIANARLAIEPIAARWAATNITDDQLKELHASVAAMEHYIDDEVRFLEENRTFHDLIGWASGNPLFGHLVDSMVGISDGSVFETEYYLAPEVGRVPVHELNATCIAHREIAAAIGNREPDLAADAMLRHIQQFVAYIETSHARVLEQPVIWDEFVV